MKESTEKNFYCLEKRGLIFFGRQNRGKLSGTGNFKNKKNYLGKKQNKFFPHILPKGLKKNQKISPPQKKQKRGV